MSGTPHLVSLQADLRGKPALTLLPQPGEPGDEIMLFAGGLKQADAWTGSAVRALVELHGRARSKRVVLGPPSDRKACNMLLSLIGAQAPEELPAHFCLANDAKVEGVKVPSTVILPAQRITHYTIADMFADVLPRRLESFPAAAARMVEKAVGAIATVAHEREAHVLQAVVTDLSAEITRAKDAAERLGAMAAESAEDEHGWWGLIDEAERRELEARLTVAAGTGRLEWQAGTEPTVAVEQVVGGFTAALEVAL
jgi:hypothetical protein